MTMCDTPEVGLPDVDFEREECIFWSKLVGANVPAVFFPR